jgi:hypothetical protein
MNFFTSDVYHSARSLNEQEYQPYRITSAYIRYCYDTAALSWSDAYALTGGKEFWGAHVTFTEHWWNKFPPRELTTLLKRDAELIAVNEADIIRAVTEDQAAFDAVLKNEPVPQSYYEYIVGFPIRISLPKFASVNGVTAFVNALPFGNTVRLRWIDNAPYRYIRFSPNGTFSEHLYRPGVSRDDDGTYHFRPMNQAQGSTFKGRDLLPHIQRSK